MKNKYLMTNPIPTAYITVNNVNPQGKSKALCPTIIMIFILTNLKLMI